MSAVAVAQAPRRAAITTVKSVRPMKQPPRIRKKLKLDENRLPIPHVHIIVRDTQQCRLEDHYHTTLQDNLMYMTYLHEPNPRKPPRKIRPMFDPEDPYTTHRVNPPVGGSRKSKETLPPSSPDSIIRLERIQLHTMVKESMNNRSALLPAIMAMRAITGESEHQGGQRNVNGVQLVQGVRSIAGWVRTGYPCGVKVDLTGPKMYDFLGTLVEFVLPRMREFPGLIMPSPSSNLTSNSAASGVISFGLPPVAMGFFPQIEVNLDAYPKPIGMHIHLVTNARGAGAQNVARTLLSGFQIPFVRK